MGERRIPQFIHRAGITTPPSFQRGAPAGLKRDLGFEAWIKYFCGETAFRVADMCMQIHGGIALTADLPIEKFRRRQRSFRITEGASEVMKMVIARAMC